MSVIDLPQGGTLPRNQPIIFGNDEPEHVSIKPDGIISPTPTRRGLKRKNDQKVCVAYCHPVGDVDARFHTSLVNLIVYDGVHRGRIMGGGAHMAVSSGAQITKTRNHIVREFLKLDGIDWLWMIDADMTFDPDTLDRLVQTAHPELRPIVGGLCFALMRGEAQEIVPTIYQYPPDGTDGYVRMNRYPDGQLIEVAGTGAACLLVHRSVLEAIGEKYPRPWQWFAEQALGDDYISEDLVFCLRARALGFPIYVDTSIKIGHVKPVVIDEQAYKEQLPPQPSVPTLVVIASKNRRDMLTNLAGQLAPQAPVIVYDNGYDEPLPGMLPAHDWPLHRMWNAGLEHAETTARQHGMKEWNVAILNDDVEVPPDFLARLSTGLRGDENNWIAYPNWHGLDIPDGVAAATKAKDPKGAGQTMSGWAFMVRGETGLRLDEQFEWWYGDTDLERQVHAAGKNVVVVGGCYANHLDPMRSTMTDPVRLAQAQADEARFAAKWGIDPAELWLAQNRDRLGENPR